MQGRRNKPWSSSLAWAGLTYNEYAPLPPCAGPLSILAVCLPPSYTCTPLLKYITALRYCIALHCTVLYSPKILFSRKVMDRYIFN